MGLDWLAGNKAKPGHEEEFRALLVRGQDGEITDEMRERFDEISIPSYTQVGAPVVGIDKAADAWVIMQERTQKMTEEELDELSSSGIDLDDPALAVPANDEEREALAEMDGYHVLEIAPACDGLPVYTMGSISDEVDLTSFRGKFLQDCVEIIGEDMWERAHENMMPDELVEYGNALLEHAERYAKENNCSEVKDWSDAPEEFDTPEALAHILYVAGRWCVYWGSRGHYLDAWF